MKIKNEIYVYQVGSRVMDRNVGIEYSAILGDISTDGKLDLEKLIPAPAYITAKGEAAVRKWRVKNWGIDYVPNGKIWKRLSPDSTIVFTTKGPGSLVPMFKKLGKLYPYLTIQYTWNSFGCGPDIKDSGHFSVTGNKWNYSSNCYNCKLVAIKEDK